MNSISKEFASTCGNEEDICKEKIAKSVEDEE